MNEHPVRTPSALVPMAISLACLALVFVHVARFGLVNEPDEGTEAHLFQLLMVVQAPIVLYYAMRWLPRHPRQAAWVLAIQVALIIAAFAAVFVFERMAARS